MGTFETQYKQLNEQQRVAVDAIEGPVLVVAGPGTGKTQLLGMRAANILQTTDTDPSNILCITFTNKAATNMQERLLNIIGSDARKIVVKTFHGLAGDIMNHYSDYFWDGARLSIAPDVVQDDIITAILATLPQDNPLAKQFGGAFTGLDDIKKAMKLAKEAGLTPDELVLAVKNNLTYLALIEPKITKFLPERLLPKLLPKLVEDIASLPTQKLPNNVPLVPLGDILATSLAVAVEHDTQDGKTTQTSKWKQRWFTKGMLSKERSTNEWWLALGTVYQQYRDALHERGYYDYADMLVEVLDQLPKHTDMLADLQEQYQYIMIDEFQDANAAQFRLAHLLASHTAHNNRPNIMAVGDDDQAIFAFQGAEISNIISFQEQYDDTRVIVLSENYRSTQPVLDAAGSIIQLADNRLVSRLPDLSKDLHANQESKAKAVVRESYPTSEQQYAAIAKMIQKSWHQGQRNIAILARGHASLVEMSKYLSNLGVPFRYERQNNILEQEAVVQVVLIADAAAAIARGDRLSLNVHLAALIRHPMWQISSKELWQLAIDNYTEPDWFSSILERDKPHFKQIADWLAALARQAATMPLPKLLDIILGLEPLGEFTSPIHGYFLKNQPLSATYIDALSGLNILRNLTREFAAKEATLEDFVRFIALNRNSKKSIANESWYQTSDQAVELLTVHSAKGLEFEDVYIVDAIDNNWKPSSRGRKAPASFTMQPYGESPDDYVRLMYVAATRAKQYVHISSYKNSDEGKQLLASPILHELPETTIDKPVDDPVALLETKLRWPTLDVTDEKQLLAGRVDTFVLSSSTLIEFLDISEAGPGAFKERSLLRLPREQTAAGSFGNAVHGALQTAQRLVNEKHFSIEVVLDRFEADLRHQYLAPLDYKRLSQHGEKLLRDILKKPEQLLPITAKPEQRFDTSIATGAKIKGTIDQLLVTKDEVLVTDYKTGKPLPSLETENKQLAHKAWKHKLQLQFYSLLLHNVARFENKNISCQLLYLEAEEQPMSIYYQPEKAELLRLSQLVQIVWEHIMKLNFPDTSAYKTTIEGIRQFEDDLLNGVI